MNRLLLGLACAATVFPAHATDWSKQFPLDWKSRYFEIHYRREGWNAATLARFADGFVDLVNRDFVAVKFDFPVQVLVLPDRATFHQFVRKEFAEPKPPNFGMYLPAFKVFATYEDSGLGSFTNQIMQPFVDRNLSAAPVWARAGIPTFFEKFIGYWDNDRLVIQ